MVLCRQVYKMNKSGLISLKRFYSADTKQDNEAQIKVENTRPDATREDLHCRTDGLNNVSLYI